MVWPQVRGIISILMILKLTLWYDVRKKESKIITWISLSFKDLSESNGLKGSNPDCNMKSVYQVSDPNSNMKSVYLFLECEILRKSAFLNNFAKQLIGNSMSYCTSNNWDWGANHWENTLWGYLKSKIWFLILKGDY